MEQQLPIKKEPCNLAPRSISQKNAGCSEQPDPDWSQWPNNIDAITKRPRTPNDPYTNLNDQMVANLHKDKSPFFHVMGPTENANSINKRYYRERYADIINKHLVRGQPGSHNFGIITPDKYHKNAQEPYTTSSQEAFEKWPGQMAGQHWLGALSQQKGGLATKSHQFGEVHERFTTIDMYRRPNTNAPGEVEMKYGRPGKGYYLQRFPTQEPYFGSEIKLNHQQDILQNIEKKTSAQYKQQASLLREEYSLRDGNWPHVSEYADKYIKKSSTQPFIRNPRDKMAVEKATEARRQCELLESN